MTDKQIYLNMVEFIKKEIPGFEVRYKTESTISKILGWFSGIFNDGYMTRYTTTRGGKVYFPSKEYVESNYRSAWRILAHEYVHLYDDKKHPVFFKLGYTFPQNLAVLSLGAIAAIWNLWFLLFLVFLAALAPIPSPGRKTAELRGYGMSMAVNLWRYGNVSDNQKDWTVKHFTDWSYYKMWPYAESLRMEIDDYIDELENLKNGEKSYVEHNPPFVKMLQFLRENKVIK